MEKKAIVLLSGGQDSTTALLWALNQLKVGKFKEVQCIGFDYGQKHKAELEYAKMNASHFNVPFDKVTIPDILTDSALIEHTLDINAPHAMNAELPASFVPGRNMLFITIAAARYAAKGFNTIVTGVCQTDYSGYPDCRRVFIDSMETSLSLATGIDWAIETPLMYLNKAETWKLAKDCGTELFMDGVEFIVMNTLTDYNGNTFLNEWGRGMLNNAASELRAKGFYEAKDLGYI